jgi:RNA polymerase sigma factor for flagellar operon FliA
MSPGEREQAVLDHLPQVRFTAQRLRSRLPQSVALEDLMHSGVLGLLEAVDKYDPRRRVQLKSYATFRIRGAMLDSLREMDWGPRSLRQRGRQMEETQCRLRARLGRRPSQAEVAKAMGLPLPRFYALSRDLRDLELCSFEETPDTASSKEDPHSQLNRKEASELLAAAIARLPDKQRRAVLLYYYEELTMSEVGQRLGVGEARISQIHSAALIRLRALFSAGRGSF